MAKLSASERAELPDSAFAYVDRAGRRRLPIHDEAHVRNALARFERVTFADDADRELARKRLLRAAKRFGIVPIGFITGQIHTERAARTADLANLPTGQVTLVMTDIEGSTRLLDELGKGYASVLTEVRRIHRRVVRGFGGHEIEARADEYFACFEAPAPAVEAAISIQRRLAERAWPSHATVRVRIGVHGGRPTMTDAGYVGLSVNTVARICAAGHGGQVVVSRRTKDALQAMPAGVRMRALGAHRLHGLSGEHRLYQVQAKGLISDFPALRIGVGAAH